MKYIILILFIISCVEQTPEKTSSLIDAGSGATYMLEGELVVTNYYSDSALLLDSDGNFKEILYNVENNQEQVVGVNWNNSTNEVVLSINGWPDRLIAISAIDGSQRVVVQTNQFNGSTLGVTVNSNGEYYAIETHRVEKFDSNGIRINNGNFPTGNLFNNLSQINLHSDGGFLVCGYGGDRVAIYNENGVQQFSAVSGISGTTNGFGCNQLSSGEVVTSWDGSSDTITVYNSDLSTTLASFSDTSILPAPRGIGIKANGNILVTDASYHYIVELSYNSDDNSLSFVRSIGGGLLNYPWQVIEIPEF